MLLENGGIMAEDVTVVEIGSSKLSLVVAQRGVNGIFNIKAKAQVEYAGFFEGEFIENSLLEDAVCSLFAQINSVYKKPIQQIYVGVPAEFSKVTTTREQLNFKFKRAVKNSDIEALSDAVTKKVKVDEMEILSINPIYFTLDDNRKLASSKLNI